MAALTLDPAVTRGVPATVERIAPTAPVSAPPTPGADIERIQQSGVLRVGYNAAALPFSYLSLLRKARSECPRRMPVLLP
jgi:hypothetical protein